MKSLILKKTASHYGGEWSDNDFVVLDSGKVVGRIMLQPHAPKGQPWFWTITAHKRRRYGRGYAGSREQAMADFKTAWERKP